MISLHAGFSHSRSLALLCCYLLSGSFAQAVPLVIDDFTTSPEWLNPESDNSALTSYTAGGVTYNSVTPIISVSESPSGVHLWGENGVDPGDATAALIDSLLDTGTLGAVASTIYNFDAPLSADDQVAVFFNASGSPSFFQQAATIEAVDAGGLTVGSILDVGPSVLTFGQTAGDALATANLDRNNGGVLANRLINGFSVSATDFGGNVSDIVGIRLVGSTTGGSADSMDYNFIGRARLGPTIAIWDAAGGGSWGTAGNWNINEVPAAVDTTFGSSINANATVTLDGDRSVAELTFDDNNSYNISGGDALTVSGDITTLQGSHTISAGTLVLAGATKTFTSSAGASLNVTGTTQTINDAAATIVLDGAGGGAIGAIRDNNDVANNLDGTDNINVIKRGSGTWTIGSASTTLEDFHGGGTTIEEGTLQVNGSSNNGELRSPTITINEGGTLDTSDFSTYNAQIGQRIEGGGTIATGSGAFQVTGAAVVAPGDNGAGVLNVDGNLSIAAGLGGSGGGFEFELSPSLNGDNDQIAVSGNVTTNTVSGAMLVTVIPTGTSLATGQYELITGNSVTGSAGDFTLDSSLQTRFTQAISVDADSVNLDVTGSNAGLVWRGNDGSNPTFWDVDGTSNWDNGGASDVFFDLDNATFDDTAVGTSVEVQGTVTPAAVTFNNSANDFTVSGTGSIAGGTVTKSGAGRVTVSTANTYTGVTNISGGVLHAAAAGALGSTSSGTTVNGGTLDITSTDITGETVSIEGAGSDGRGALITDGLDALGGGTQQISDVVQTGDATIGAYAPDQPAGALFTANDYRWDLETGGVASSASWRGNGHSLTKRGRGTISIQDTGEMDVSSINIEQGVLFWQGTTTATGATVTIGDGTNAWVAADLQTGSAELNTFYLDNRAPAAHAVDLVLQGGAFVHQTSNGTAIAVTGSVAQSNVSGDGTIDNAIIATGGDLTIPNAITGDGDLRYAGTGVVELQANSPYTGRTEVLGNLRLTGAGGLSGTSAISVIGGGNVDVSGRGDSTLTIASGQRLIGELDAAETGGGSVTGNVVVQSGGTLQVNTGAGMPLPSTLAFQQNADTIGAGNFRYVAFEAEDFTTYNDNSDFDWSTEAVNDSNGDPALGGEAIVGAGVQDSSFTGGNDDSAQYDIVFSEPGTYTWYVRTRAAAGNMDSFFGPSENVDSTNLSGEPAGGLSAWIGNGSLEDAEGGDGITPEWDWVRSDPSGDPGRVAFETVTVTQDDVDEGRVFSLAFEPRQVGATLDKIALVATPAFTDLTDQDLTDIAVNIAELVQPPVPTFSFIVDGDLTLESSSTLEIDIRGLIDFDSVDVTGTADLSGLLAVNLDGFIPEVNDEFTILSADTLIDSGIVLGGPNGSAFSLSTAGDALTLTFNGLVGLAGDFNGDGVVDAADYTVWRDNLGAGDESSLNGNGDGVNGVDVADYALWQANFGNTLAASGAATVAPEPVSAMLLLLGMAAACGAARR